MRWSSRRQNRNRKPHASDKPESAWSTVRFLLGLALLAWVIRSFVVAPFSIPSGSMLPTLYIGDYVMVAKWPYGYSSVSFPFGFPRFGGRILRGLPERGDVVVFRHPAENTDLIKRVIGLPGDTVEVRGGQLILNGRAARHGPSTRFDVPVSLNSPCRSHSPGREPNDTQCSYSGYLEALPGNGRFPMLDQVEGGPADEFGPVEVPAGHVFLMGDNRDDSLDSRFSPLEGGVGMVPIDRLIGRAAFTFWSTDGSASYVKPWTWFTALRWDRIGMGYSGAHQ